MFNSVFLSGNVGDNILLNRTMDDIPACSFYIAIDVHPKRNIASEPVWVRINAYGELAVLCHERIKKGNLIVIRGEIMNRRYSGRDDGLIATEIRCNEVIFNRG